MVISGADSLSWTISVCKATCIDSWLARHCCCPA